MSATTITGATHVSGATIIGTTVKGTTVSGNTVTGATIVKAPTVSGTTTVAGPTVCGTTAVYGATIYENGTSLASKYAALHGNASNTFTALTFYGNIAWSSITDKPASFSDYGLKVQGDGKYTSASTNGASAITVSAITKDVSAATSTATALADAYQTKAYIENYVANALSSSVSYKGTTTTYSVAAIVGDMYIASSSFTIPSGQSANGAAATVENGDYIICRTSGTTTTSKWDVVQKNLTNAVTYSQSMTNGQVVIASGTGTIKSQSLDSTTVGNSDKVDGYHVAVVTSTSAMTDANTIYILRGTATDPESQLSQI